MYTKSVNQKPKVRPGLSLNSRQIRSRLRNKTVSKSNPMNEEFIQDEDLIKITRMNKVEREMNARKNLKEIEEIQKRMEQSSNAKKQKDEERRIEQLANERLKQLRDEDSKKTSI